MKVINPYKFKKFVRTFLCSCINGVCMGFVIWQTIKCMIKFIEKSKGTEVSMKKSANLSFPAITVCGLFGKDVNGDDMGLNETYLQNVCGLRQDCCFAFELNFWSIKVENFFLGIWIILMDNGQTTTVPIQKNYLKPYPSNLKKSSKI